MMLITSYFFSKKYLLHRPPYVCMYACMHVCLYVCIYIHTCCVLIKPPMPIHYVLAAVFASCFYVLFKIRFVRGDTQGGVLVNPLK